MIIQYHTLRNAIGSAVRGDEGMTSFADDGGLCVTAKEVCRWRPPPPAPAAAYTPRRIGLRNCTSRTCMSIGVLARLLAHSNWGHTSRFCEVNVGSITVVASQLTERGDKGVRSRVPVCGGDARLLAGTTGAPVACSVCVDSWLAQALIRNDSRPQT